MKLLPLIILPFLLACSNEAPPTTKEVTTVTVPTETDTALTTNKKTIKQLSINTDQIILFNTEVHEHSVNLVISEIQKLSKTNKDIYILLDSPGGSVFDGNRLISYIEGSTVKVYTVNTGMCASMCAQIFSHGAKRYAIDRSVLMFHQAAGGVSGRVKSMKHLLAFVDKEVRKLDAYVATRAGLTPEAFDRLVENDLWLAADDSLSLKLADELVQLTVQAGSGDMFDLKNELKKKNIEIKKITTTLNPLSEIY